MGKEAGTPNPFVYEIHGLGGLVRYREDMNPANQAHLRNLQTGNPPAILFLAPWLDEMIKKYQAYGNRITFKDVLDYETGKKTPPSPNRPKGRSREM